MKSSRTGKSLCRLGAYTDTVKERERCIDTSWPLTAVRISFYSEGVGDEVVKHEQKMAHSGLCFNKS